MAKYKKGKKKGNKQMVEIEEITVIEIDRDEKILQLENNLQSFEHQKTEADTQIPLIEAEIAELKAIK
jgi:hypothetical protein|tara:strand:+ start:841 stop:1044 length:204 start_codon:yes stop_codon:yes gene_type:complete